MEIDKYLSIVSYVGKSQLKNNNRDCYYSKFDNSYITSVGMEYNVSFLAIHEITEQLTWGVGFSPKENKWYGWSHRAICGFEIGSICSKGDYHYRASNEEDEIEAALDFWSEENRLDIMAMKIKDGEIYIEWTYGDKIPNKGLRNKVSSILWFYDSKNFGRGEWIAESLEDAKQMAIDFNKGVS